MRLSEHPRQDGFSLVSGWDEPVRVGERGRECTYRSDWINARLIADCHRDPRKLEITFRRPPLWPLEDVVRVLGAPQVISPGALAVLDCPGAYLLHVLTDRVHATLRKAAPMVVVQDILVLMESAAGGPPLLPHTHLPKRNSTGESRCGVCCEQLRKMGTAQHNPPLEQMQQELDE